MSERKWRPQYDKPQRAGDVFGDFQVGEAFVVTYHLDNAPNVRVSAYFGIEQVPQSGTERYRYSPVSTISLEKLEGPDNDVVDSVDVPNHERFPFDWPTFSPAHRDMRDEMWRWQKTKWDTNDFWDGEDFPRG